MDRAYLTHRTNWQKRAALVVLLCLATGVGCQRQQKGDTGKSYAPDSQPAKGSGAGGGQSAGRGQSDAGPLNSPADTTNGKSSSASDRGSSDATRGQVVSEPGAPVEHAAAKPQPRQEH